ncbi:Ldh family oxidoreductase [Serratia marcescens]|uniref:Ldh family oxidoreductase n=1 Tax=Serratia marcescens TaxID=615 RepID=UPI003512EAC1
MAKVVHAEALKAFGKRVFQAFGVPENDALMLSDSLVMAELWGHSSHGMLRLPWYVNRLRQGAMSPEDVSITVTDAGSLVVIDANHSMGQVMAMKAIGMGMARAKQHGISAVAVRNSNHFGTAAYFTRQVAESGFISLFVTNASPAMAPWGGSQKLIGTNPWSIAAPAGKRGVVVMDIANTAVARGKIYLAAERNETIPDFWATDAHGVPTTLAGEAVHGLLLPMAGHKGYAIAFMMDILAGVLTGSQFGKDVAGPYDATQKSGCGHLLITIDIAGMITNDEFNNRINKLIDQVKAVPATQGVAEIFFPGEIENRQAAENVKHGIILADNTWQGLARLAEEAAVALPAAIPTLAQ